MGKKKVHHEEHADETWLLPYSDMMTLLLALFIVLFAMGQTDKEKFATMSREFNIIFAGGSGMMQQDGSSAIPLNFPNAAISENAGSDSNGSIEEDKMNSVKGKLENEIKDNGYSDKVKVELTNEGLEISIQDVVLFNSGDADVLKGSEKLLIDMSKMLQSLDNDIKIVGHTDNVPIKNVKFRSNWDLSSMRAVNVMNFMVEYGKLSAEKFSVQAYGEFKPKYDNSTPDGRAKNRRVEIFIIRKYPVGTNTTK
jgi:chemotaxis protein MotB